jgi:hypothetical protein
VAPKAGVRLGVVDGDGQGASASRLLEVIKMAAKRIERIGVEH